PVEPKLPDVDISCASLPAEIFALAIRFNGCVETIGKNSLHFVVTFGSFGKVRHLAGFRVDSLYRRASLRLITGEGHFRVVVVKVLRLEHAAAIFALVHGFLMCKLRCARKINVGYDQPRSVFGNLRGLRCSLRKRDFQTLLRNSSSFAHFLAQLDWLRAAHFAQKPKLVVARAAGPSVFKVVRTDQDVVSGNQVHDAQESRRRNVASKALNDARLEVDDHGISEAFGHERNALVVRRNVRALAEVSKDLDVRGQMQQRVVRRSSAGEKQQSETNDEGTHAEMLTLSR